MDSINQNTTGASVPETGGGNTKKRSSKKLLLWGFIVFFVIAGVAGVSYAQKMKQFRDKGPMFFMMEKIVKDLNLTEQQKADVDKIREEIKAKRESMKKDHESGMTDFENAFKQDKLDKETLKSIMQKREAQREEMKDFMLDELIKFHAVLTPEQRTKAVEKVKEMREKGREMFKKRHDKNDKFEIPPDQK